jgi:hypothetical protein
VTQELFTGLQHTRGKERILASLNAVNISKPYVHMCVCYSIFVEETFIYEYNFRAENLIARKAVAKFFPRKVIIWL